MGGGVRPKRSSFVKPRSDPSMIKHLNKKRENTESPMLSCSGNDKVFRTQPSEMPQGLKI